MQRFLCKSQFNILLTKYFFQLGIKWLGRYNNGTWRSPEFYIDGYYWFSAAGGQERSKYGPEWAAFISICIVTSVAFCQFARKLSLIQLGDLAVLEGSPSLQLLVSTCHCYLCPEVIKELFFTGSLCFFFCGRM